MASAETKLHWRSAALTHPGKVRRLNEDGYLDVPASGIWAVADGMGGHHAGDVASRTVIDALAEVATQDTLDALIAECEARLQAANQQLFRSGQGAGSRVSGATVVVLLSVGREAALLWAGDSRAYRLRGHGEQAALEQLTADHSRVAELVSRGLLAEADMESHPDANVITRAVGVREAVDLDLRRVTIQPGDTFLLCSDGLSRYVGSTALTAALGLGAVGAAADQLQQAALATPARDNITVIVARAGGIQNSQTVLNTAGDQRARPVEDPTLRNDGHTEPGGGSE